MKSSFSRFSIVSFLWIGNDTSVRSSISWSDLTGICRPFWQWLPFSLILGLIFQARECHLHEVKRRGLWVQFVVPIKGGFRSINPSNKEGLGNRPPSVDLIKFANKPAPPRCETFERFCGVFVTFCCLENACWLPLQFEWRWISSCVWAARAGRNYYNLLRIKSS